MEVTHKYVIYKFGVLTNQKYYVSNITKEKIGVTKSLYDAIEIKRKKLAKMIQRQLNEGKEVEEYKVLEIKTTIEIIEEVE